MDTYSILRQIADSWGLLAMVIAYIVERVRTVGANLFSFVSDNLCK